jgi:DNA-binding transcriptional LysR family regulator
MNAQLAYENAWLVARLACVLDWDDLRFFLAVARGGSLSAAARTLEVTQPTVGRRIAALERKLDAKLFIGGARGQSLSTTGRRMLAHAEHMELDAVAAERVAFGRDAGLRGHVCLTASEWLLNSLIAPAVAAFCARHAELELELLAETRHLSLMRREADIALRPSRFDEDDVVQREVGEMSFGLYASDAYLAAHGVPDFASGAAGHRLVAMSTSLRKVPEVTWLPTIVPRASVVVRCNGREPMLILALAGVGLACLPRVLGDRTPRLRLLPTPGLAPVRTLWLCVHRDTRALPRVRATLGFLKDTLQRFGPALRPT